MKRKSRSLIPEQAQVPVALGGAVVLAILLVWRLGLFGGGGEESAAPAGASVAIVEVEAGQAEVEALQQLVTTARAQMATAAPASAALPPLHRNPFSPLDALLDLEPADAQPQTEITIEAIEQALPPPEPTGPSIEELERQQALADLRLTGVIMNGGFAMAIVNGAYLRAGEQMGRFRVKEIRERELVVEDRLGTATVPLQERDRWRAQVEVVDHWEPLLAEDAEGAASARDSGADAEGSGNS